MRGLLDDDRHAADREAKRAPRRAGRRTRRVQHVVSGTSAVCIPRYGVVVTDSNNSDGLNDVDLISPADIRLFLEVG